MTNPIRDDVADELEHFITMFRATLDPDRYPRVADGDLFEGELVHLEAAFETIKNVFHDYLISLWSHEISQSLGVRPGGGYATKSHPSRERSS